jgi:hypothetical protein
VFGLVSANDALNLELYVFLVNLASIRAGVLVLAFLVVVAVLPTVFEDNVIAV